MMLLDVITANMTAVAAQLEVLLQSGQLFSHSADASSPNEIFAQAVLRPMLPLRYGLVHGMAFNAEGNTSARTTLIYDHTYGLPTGAQQPCETVFAAVDVRETLDADELCNGIEVIASVKRLRREKATDYDVTPNHHLGMFGARYAQMSDDAQNPYLGYIFAQHAPSAEAILAMLDEQIREGKLKPEHTPDAIFCLADAWAVVRQTRTGYLAIPRTSFAKFGVVRPTQHLLTFVSLLLNLSLSRVVLRGPDLMRAIESFLQAK